MTRWTRQDEGRLRNYAGSPPLQPTLTSHRSSPSEGHTHIGCQGVCRSRPLVERIGSLSRVAFGKLTTTERHAPCPRAPRTLPKKPGTAGEHVHPKSCPPHQIAL